LLFNNLRLFRFFSTIELTSNLFLLLSIAFRWLGIFKKEFPFKPVATAPPPINVILYLMSTPPT